MYKTIMNRFYRMEFFARVIAGFFVLVMLGTGQAVADNVEYFKESDLSCEYIVPNKMHPELSYVRLTVLFAHCYNGAEDMRSSGFRYDKGDSEYTGANLYLSDGVLKDACFLWFSTAGKNAAEFQYSGKANGADSASIAKNGWRLGEITYENFVKPTKASDHECNEAHYCYMHVILYPPVSMNNKKFTIRLDGGPSKNYGKQGRNWCWWREGLHYNQYGTTTKEFTLAFPYNVGKLDITDMRVDRNGILVTDFSLPGDSLNATKIVQGEFVCGKDTVKENSGFLSTYLVDNTLQNRTMASGAVHKYDGKKTEVSGRIYMPAGYNSTAETKAVHYYRGFPYAEMTEATFSMENSCVKLRWNVKGDTILNDTCVRGGHWYIIRRDAENTVFKTVSLPLPLTTREWNDFGMELNHPGEYRYGVVYRRDDWGETFDDVLTVDASKRNVSTKTNCNLTVETYGMSDRVRIKADCSAAKTDGFYTMNIYRGNLILQSNIQLKADQGSYTTNDVSGLNGTLYARVGNTYKVQLLHNGKIFDEKEAIGNITGGTAIGGLTATKGDHRGYVRLTWSADRSAQDNTVDTCIIERRILNSQTDDGFIEVDRIPTSSTFVTYEDKGAKPGDYYEYRVSVCGTDHKGYNSIRAVGFAAATGTISGTVKLRDGSAQSGVTVSLDGRNESATNLPKVLLHSMRMDGKNNQDSCMIRISQSADEYRKFVTGDNTIQFWYRTDRAEGSEPLLTLPGCQSALTVEKQSYRQLLHLTGTNYTITVDTLSANTFPWVHVTLQKSGSGLYCLKTAYTDVKGKLVTDSCKAWVSGSFTSTAYTCPLFGVTAKKGETAFNGEMDEVRLYSRQISDAEISDTRYCRLSGKEKDLYCYLPMDEGICGYTFDHAQTSGRVHSASLGKAVIPSAATPDNFTAYAAKTDNHGFYAISGIELTNATFCVTPSRNGITDRFGPAARYCTLSSDVTSLSDQNFVDSSAVTVSGRVCYRWGTYPVEGAKVKVDGNTVQRNGRDVLTDRNGEFQIEIPVGGHYIEVAKENHGFLQGGRFPRADVYNFRRDTAYIDFTDSTLVLLRGRVSGGAEQAALPMGVGRNGGSKALIGQATLYLAPASNLNYRLNKSTKDTITVDTDHNLLVAADTAICNSKEYLLPYQANPTIAGQVQIKTDPSSGEFRALLPPMTYRVTYGRTKSVSNDELNTAGLTEFNMKPGNVSKLNIRYDTKPVFEILDYNHQDSLGGNDGMYGEDTLTLEGVKYPVIDRSIVGKPKYVMGYPVFNSGKQYTLLIHARQNFVNADLEGGAPVANEVPLAGQLLSFAYNKWGVSEVDTVRLNSQGRGVYRFRAAYPRSEETPVFTLEGTCQLSGRSYGIPEEPVKALFTGFSLYEGQATLVDGPSAVDFILRDPPGSGSFATLQKGSTLTSSVVYSGNTNTGTQSEFHISAGTEWNSDTWSVSGKYNFNHNWSDVKSEGTGNGAQNSVTTTETYSTASDAYHVGAMGDLFIGHGTYTQYGKGYYYGIKEGTPSAGELSLKSADGSRTAVFSGRETMGCTVGAVKTSFALDERYILQTLIPEWENVAKTSTSTDSIRMANNNVSLWRNIVALNEMQKLNAFQHKADTTVTYSSGLAEKFSFSSAVKQSNSTGGSGLNAVEWKLSNNNTLSFFVYFNTGGGSGTTATTDYGYTNEETRQETVSHSYTLSDTDPKDNFDVSVYNRASSPIFRINAGASTNPWEGADTTKCYMPGQKLLSTPTLKVEKCSLRILNPTITEIPNGREATVQLQLTNESEADRNQTFYLYASDDTHNTGLVMTIDGAALTTAGIPVYIAAHQSIIQTMKVKQTRMDILNYDDLKICMGGQHVQTFEYSNPELYPQRTFSVHFKSSSSPVTFSVRDTSDQKITCVNIGSGSRIKLRAEDYQTDYKGFYKMRMQYKAANETQWHTLGKEWLVGELQGTTRKDTLWDMKDMADGRYQLRAVTLSQYGTGDVPFYSDTITIVKDMVAPQLLGEPQPVDGKLGCESEIRYTFSEDIYSGAVTKSNISVKMYKGSVSANTKVSGGGEDIAFDYVVSENTIVISPTTDKLLLEGNTLVVTISDIEDLNGNKAAATAAKYIYVHQSPFAWIQGSDDVIAFYNLSSGVKQWSLQNIPSWVQLCDANTMYSAPTSGTVGPNEYVIFYRKIKDGLSIGEYCDTMRVVDGEGLGESIQLRYVQYAESPYWVVSNPYSAYNSTFTARLWKDGVVRATDLVGAFINDTTCIGTTYPTFVSSENEYRVMMNIHTDEAQKDKEIQFKLYDSMHDVIYPYLKLQTDSGKVATITAPQDNVTKWGTTERPWQLTITDWNEHIYKLNWGWNWLSFNMDLEKDQRTAKVFLPENAPIEILDEVKTQNHSGKRDGQTFYGDLASDDFEPGKMLMVKANRNCQVSVKGYQINASCYNIALQPAGKKGPSYNWIGYTALDAVSLEEAFPTMPLAEGDILKSQTDFAYYTHGTWVGTLDKLEPLKGYIFTSNADTVRHFIFPEIGEMQVNARVKVQGSSLSSDASGARSLSSKLSADCPWTWDPTQWSMNMTAIATVQLDLEPITTGNIGIFDADDNCRCIKSITDDGHVYLTISGDDRCDLKMRLQTEDGQIYEQACPFTFTANDSRGTYSDPVVLYFGKQPVGICNVNADADADANAYNLAGQRVRKADHKGVYIENGEKVIIR